jgi:hypothetical protein
MRLSIPSASRSQYRDIELHNQDKNCIVVQEIILEGKIFLALGEAF